MSLLSSHMLDSGGRKALPLPTLLELMKFKSTSSLVQSILAVPEISGKERKTLSPGQARLFKHLKTLLLPYKDLDGIDTSSPCYCTLSPHSFSQIRGFHCTVHL